jgi:hypothetical protein
MKNQHKKWNALTKTCDLILGQELQFWKSKYVKKSK